MTKWEIGQELIQLSDNIREVRDELSKDGHEDLAAKLKVIQATIGDLFNEPGNSDHHFGIFDSSNLKIKEGAR